MIITNPYAFGASAPTPVTDIFTVPGTWHSPVGVTSIDLIRIWGGGGGGGNGTATAGGGAAGGGAFASSANVPVDPDTDYAVVVGGAVAAQETGNSSDFNAGQVLAVGGRRGLDTIGGRGGAAADCFGEVTKNGGDGGSSDTGNGGGGGGGGAGTDNDGNVGTDGTLIAAGTGGIGGATDGGTGGDGRLTTNAPAGLVRGGGGGGGGISGLGTLGGNGARGEVRITYTPV